MSSQSSITGRIHHDRSSPSVSRHQDGLSIAPRDFSGSRRKSQTCRAGSWSKLVLQAAQQKYTVRPDRSER
jgi:hypothetical protein